MLTELHYRLVWEKAVVRPASSGFALRVSVDPKPENLWCEAFGALSKTQNAAGVRSWRIGREGAKLIVAGLADGDEGDIRAVLEWMVWEAAVQARRAAKELQEREWEAARRRAAAVEEAARRRAAAEKEEVARRARADELTARFRRGVGDDKGDVIDDEFLGPAITPRRS